jgi:flagellar biosynthesis/type III secretory pathway chaperone
MTAADDLEDLLAMERQKILKGHIKELEALGARKLALLSAVRDDANTSTEQLEGIMATAKRNALLLAASGRGLRAAIRQITDAKTQEQQAFYGPNGQRKPMLPRRDRLEQKL